MGKTSRGVLFVLLWLLSLGVAFWAGQNYASYTKWQPIGTDLWQKKLITRHGVVTLTLDGTYGIPLWTIRIPCSLSGTRGEVIYDYLVDSERAGVRRCDGSNSEQLPDPAWAEWFKDAPATAESRHPTHPHEPGITTTPHYERADPLRPTMDT